MKHLLTTGHHVTASYRLVYFLDAGVEALTEAEQFDAATGFLIPFRGGFAIQTGIDQGPVAVTAVAYDRAPALRLSNWEEAAEVSIQAPTGTVTLSPLFDSPSGAVVITRDGPGWYRVRCNTQGRSDGLRAFVSSTVHESYLVEIWPGPDSPNVIYKHLNLD